MGQVHVTLHLLRLPLLREEHGLLLVRLWIRRGRWQHGEGDVVAKGARLIMVSRRQGTPVAAEEVLADEVESEVVDFSGELHAGTEGWHGVTVENYSMVVADICELVCEFCCGAVRFVGVYVLIGQLRKETGRPMFSLAFDVI